MADHPTHPDIHLMDGNFYANDPHPCFTWMRANAPVYRDEKAGVWGITLHADVMECSRNPEIFITGIERMPVAIPRRA